MTHDHVQSANLAAEKWIREQFGENVVLILKTSTTVGTIPDAENALMGFFAGWVARDKMPDGSNQGAQNE